jgi:hypothetical protein
MIANYIAILPVEDESSSDSSRRDRANRMHLSDRRLIQLCINYRRYWLTFPSMMMNHSESLRDSFLMKLNLHR